MRELKILAPCGMLGYGFPEYSFRAGMACKPDAIVVDAGSTDAGPHKLGAGVAIVSRKACKKDLELMITGGAEAGIPVIIGSAGGAGGRVHVEWTLAIIDEIIKEHDLIGLKLAVIWADVDKALVADRLSKGKVDPLGKTVPELTPERLAKTTGIVAQMGHEPVVKALENGADIIVCGRAYDPSPFAAVAAFHGFDLKYGYHAGKILECAALCAQTGTTKDCMLGVIYRDGFTLTPLSENRVCTRTSVAAHTFYEKDHPYILHGPGFALDLESCNFKELADGRSVFVQNSQLIRQERYRVKLEGAMQTAYRTFVVAGVRDPLLIMKLEETEALAEAQTRSYYTDIPAEDYQIRFLNYGINGVMGTREPKNDLPHEVGILFEVLAKTQEMADAVCATLRSTLLHYGYEGRKSTAGNLAFPFAPSDVSFGPVYEFSVYHLMDVENGLELFPIEYRTGGAVG